jgi:DNA polymerase III delta subunit
MITLLSGENSFELRRALNDLRGSFQGETITIDGSGIELRSLPDLLMGVSLFSEKRMVIIRGLSENKTLWGSLVDWLPRLSDDIWLVLVEPKPDKRMLTYKELKKAADVREYIPWTDRDTSRAEAWIIDEAKRQNVTLDKKSAQHIVRRVGVDQWHLFHAVEKLALVDVITLDKIDDTIDAQPNENVFSLFETALEGNTTKLLTTLRTLELSQDPYALFGLLSSQAFQLAAVVNASPNDNVAKDFAIHPYVISKLSSIAKRKGKAGVRKVISALAKADDDMKISKADPWILIESALMHIATQA